MLVLGFLHLSYFQFNEVRSFLERLIWRDRPELN